MQLALTRYNIRMAANLLFLKNHHDLQSLVTTVANSSLQDKKHIGS